MEEMLRGFDVRKQEELERLRRLAGSQVLVARQHAEQQVESLQMLHAVQVKKMYETCMHLITRPTEDQTLHRHGGALGVSLHPDFSAITSCGRHTARARQADATWQLHLEEQV